MTAPLSAAGSFLLELDALIAAKRPGEVRMIYVLAAGTIRGLLDEIQVLHARDAVDEADDDELDALLHRAAEHAQRLCPEHGIMCPGADCCCAHRHQDEAAGRDSNPQTPRNGLRDVHTGPDRTAPDSDTAPGSLAPILGDISEEEHAEAVAYLTAKHGKVPPSLQRVIDMGGRIRREVRTFDAIACEDLPSARRPGWPAVLLDRPGPFACGNCGSYRWSSSDGFTCQCGDCGQSGPLVEVHPSGLARRASVRPGDALPDMVSIRSMPTCPDHDLNMPHDIRYQGWRSCPPNCPYLRWHVEHGLIADVPRPEHGEGRIPEPSGLATMPDGTGPVPPDGHALRPPEWVCSDCSRRFSGRKPEDGLCNLCSVNERPVTLSPAANALLAEPAEPFRLTAVDGGEPE